MRNIDSRVSIIISTFNAERELNKCIESVLNQTYNNFELLVIDDYSKDKTVEIIESWQLKDKRIKLIEVNSKNKGLTKNLNKLLEVSKSEFIARMDADDICEPTRIEEQVNYLENNPQISLVGSTAYQINDEGIKKDIIRRVPLSNDEIKKTIIKANPIIHPSVMFRREDIINIGGYNEDYRTAQDYELWFRCLANGLQMANLDKPLIRYRVSDDHVTKRGLKYRLLDAKIRWHGTKKLGIGFLKRAVSVSIPLLLGIMPLWLKKLALRHSHKIDPRQKVKT